MDKELRGCDAYQNLESTVRNMITSLRAVAELQNPAIRERHWEQLMTATKVSGISLNIKPSNLELSSGLNLILLFPYVPTCYFRGLFF